MATIVAVGIATLDIINSVAHYPQQNSEVRATSQRKSRGGNATNTLVVLSQLGHQCRWAGVAIDEPDFKLIQDELDQFEIDTHHCQRLASGKIPTSYITLSQDNGSRSIVHYRDCPEFSFEQFKTIAFSDVDWVHFEGRNIDQTQLMMQYLVKHFPDIPRSLEVEKPRPDIEQLFELATICFFSKDYAIAHGHDSAEQLLHSLPNNTKATCTWGDQGAWSIDDNNQISHSPAFKPSQLIDTLGAGDTFNAAMIDQLIKQKPLEQAISYACQLAGYKCSQQGLTSLSAGIDATL